MKREKRTFKIGEEIWFMGGSACFPEIMRAKITSICDPWGDGKHQLLLSLDSLLQPRLVSGAVFKSREALCDHYRKIFE